MMILHTKVQYGKTARQYIKSTEGLAELNHFLCLVFFCNYNEACNSNKKPYMLFQVSTVTI